MPAPLIIEAAVNGGTFKAQNPNVPRSVDEIVDDAGACIENGATIIHHHTDDSILQARHATEPYRVAWRRIRADHRDVVLYPTMGGGGPSDTAASAGSARSTTCAPSGSGANVSFTDLKLMSSASGPVL